MAAASTLEEAPAPVEPDVATALVDEPVTTTAVEEAVAVPAAEVASPVVEEAAAAPVETRAEVPKREYIVVVLEGTPKEEKSPKVLGVGPMTGRIIPAPDEDDAPASE
ncbi:brain acid soluble protein 1-like [Stegastes partitus]|uniref:Brain acid soluble protein 1-like n=1 Tax=Stegastes partitus TaxID=144197 RepID=A0A9Y4KA90_9TELE|nr:PREDICTED: brain acid soluble protein 1-like [Stegastes partitus]